MLDIKSYLVEAHVIRKMKDDIEFLLLKRSPEEIYPGIWQMVTGKINDNEKAYQCAVREIKEETNLEIEKLWVVPHVNSFYSHEKNHICLVPVFAALVGSDAEVKISEEHKEYDWVQKDEAKELLAWEGQRKSVDIIHDYFLNRQSTFKFIQIKL